MKAWKNHRYFILAIGRKGRKTTFDINELFFQAMSDERGLTYPFIGPTRTQAKEIVWEDHVLAILRLCDENGIEYQRNNSELFIRFPGYGKVTVDGGDNIESLRGKSDWGGVVLDEFASWKNKRYAWEEVVEPNLLVHDAWAIVSGTPKGYEYFHSLMKLGDQEGKIEGEAFDDEGDIIHSHQDFISFRFTSYDNPFLDHEWINRKKERLTVRTFGQEYLARFEHFTGIIYKEFDRRIHLIEPPIIPLSWEIYRAMDFGATHPTVCLWIAVDNQKRVFVFDEYYQAGERISTHAEAIKAKSGKLPIVATYGDPSAEQAILDYAQYEVYITPALKYHPDDKNWVRHGIDAVGQLFKLQNNVPQIFISRKCQNLIRELETYHWKETKSEEGLKDIPEKHEDDCVDALRYFVVSWMQPINPEYRYPIPSSIRISTNKFTGY